jgi:subtilisin family serine protease
VRLLRSPLQPRHPLGDAVGRVSFTVALPRGVTAASRGLLGVAPGVGAIRLTPSEVHAFQAQHPELTLHTTPLRQPLLDRSAVWTRAAEVRRETALDGSGVVVGILDTGVDVSHPDFRDAAGNTRVAWLMSLASPGGLHPELEEKFGCSSAQQTSCAIYDREDIDRMLAAGDPDESLRDVEGHGTHVASIAAGNGGVMKTALPRYVGMAPGATIIVASPSIAGRGFADADILNAARFIFDRADALGLPAVLNLSVGSDFGAHDGTSDLEMGLAALVGDDKPGRAIVVAAGNSGALYSAADGDGPLGVHTEVHSSPYGVTRVPIAVPASKGGQGYVWVTFRPGDQVAVGLEGPGGKRWIALTEPGEERGYEGDDGTVGAVINNLVNGKTSLTANTNGAVVAFNGAWPSGEFAVLLEGRGDAELWVAGQGDVSDALMFRRALRQGTINVPASHPSLLAVGCSLNRVSWQPLGGADEVELEALGGERPPVEDSLCYFSSAGPTPFGVAKPELTAPGGFVAAAMSADADPRVSPGGLFDSIGCPDENACYLVDDRHAVTAGTSMSAPHVSGAIALLLQKDPNLTQARLTEILQAGARYPTGPVRSETQLGVGSLDVMGALHVMAEEQGMSVAPDLTKSWFVLSSGYARPDPTWPVWGTIELRRADGTIAGGLDGTELALDVDGGVIAQPLVKVRQGMWRFAVAGARGSGGSSMRLSVTYAGQLLGQPRTIPIGVDAWAAGRGALATGGGCAVTNAPSLRRGGDAGLLWLVALSAMLRGRRAGIKA